MNFRRKNLNTSVEIEFMRNKLFLKGKGFYWGGLGFRRSGGGSPTGPPDDDPKLADRGVHFPSPNGPPGPGR